VTNNWLRLPIAAFTLMVMCGCNATESEPQNRAASNQEFVMESINNPVFDDNSIRFSAISNGCTTSSDFIVEHLINNGRCELTVLRAKPDLCRKASALIDIELPWSLPESCTPDMEVVFLNPEAGQLDSGVERTLSE